jgi:2-haloacid dehalogenase
MAIDNVVFDLGGVLIDWNPRYVYRQLFDDHREMERFLAEVCSAEWNARQDAGRPWSEAVAELVATHPEYEPQIRAYHERWPEMLGGPIEETVAVLHEVRATGRRVYGLSNWSAETFVLARDMPEYAFLGSFDGLVISGEIGICKPDPAIFRHLIERYRLDAGRTVFIDDLQRNVDVARTLGLEAIRFEGADRLRADLQELGILDGVVPSAASSSDRQEAEEEASPRSMG